MNIMCNYYFLLPFYFTLCYVLNANEYQLALTFMSMSARKHMPTQKHLRNSYSTMRINLNLYIDFCFNLFPIDHTFSQYFLYFLTNDKDSFISKIISVERRIGDETHNGKQIHCLSSRVKC